jgi:hypothetical protein
MSQPSPIEAYLDELVIAYVDRAPRELRGMLAETEAHLRDAADAAMARGVPRLAAEADAVARFGPAHDVAAADHRRLPARHVVEQLARHALLLFGVGAVAVGLSGAVAAIIRLIGGSRAVIDVAPGRVLSAGDCARWLGADAGAHSCAAAAVGDWADEVVYYRLALGVLGLLALLAYRWVRRGVRSSAKLLTVRDTVGVTSFAAAAALTFGLGVDALVVGGGSGQWFSATPIALALAVAFAVLLLRDLRRPEVG